MVQNKQIRNFLFLLSGIVLLFCGSIPNFAESVIALLRGLLSFINLGWIGTLLIISRVCSFWEVPPYLSSAPSS